MSAAALRAGRGESEAHEEDAVFCKVTLRLLPFLGLCYLAAYVDRVNVGFAKLRMTQDLGLSDVAYGFGAGIFFLGYFLFEVPSNLLLHRVGAKVWLARIMISWALISAASAALAPIGTVLGPDAARYAFYLIRFLLGAAEAGFFPGVLLYLTYWFPPSRRSLAIGRFILAQPIAFVLGAPVSGLILARCQGLGGLQAWQWMYLLEALPAIILGVVLLLRLDNGIKEARWLSAEEKATVLRALAAEQMPSADLALGSLWRSVAMWWLSLAYFLLVLGAYGLNFWLPSIVKSAGVQGELSVGFLTALPYALGVAVMLTLAARTRAARQARLGSASMCVVAGIGLAASALLSGQLWLMMVGMALGVAGYLAANTLFWRLPSAVWEGRALAAAIAAINAVGNLGGFVGPYLTGALIGRSGDARSALYALAIALATSGLVLFLRPSATADA